MMSRKMYLIDRLIELDDKYLDFPLFDYKLAELEVMHIKELNRAKHKKRWVVVNS